MSWNDALSPHCPEAGAAGAIETQIIPRARDIGGFEVRRALPAPKRQMVGPFVFFDQMGPAEFISEGGIDVRPHPHIGLSTVTYLYAGEFLHCDSLGTQQMIYPGEVNWMTAGRGITHSERTSPATRKTRHALFGIQTWVALPEHLEDIAPDFDHFGADKLPVIEAEGKTVTLLLGSAYGETSPVAVHSHMMYADVTLAPGAAIPLPTDHEDRGVFVSKGSIDIAGDHFDAGQMLVFRPGDAITVRAGAEGARLILLGGDTESKPRHLWWNFVSTSKEKIEAAAAAWRAEDWTNGPFRLPQHDDRDFIPLTERAI